MKINNPQQSWGFEWEPPKAVMKDSGTRDWTLWGGKLQLRRLRALGIGTVISSIVETKYALLQNQAERIWRLTLHILPNAGPPPPPNVDGYEAVTLRFS